MIKRMQELVAICNDYSYHYYTLDNPIVTDAEYDKCYDELLALERASGVVLENSPTKRVGGDIIDKFLKHTHKASLFSLDKAVTNAELFAFDERVKKVVARPKYTVEYKFDGLTINLTYENGKFQRATTRGNGVVGEDVTAQVLTIKTFPLEIEEKGLMEIQGEAMMKLSTLDKYNQTATEKLKNARNAVAGGIRNLDPKVTAKRNLEILFYNINYSENLSFENQGEMMKFLKQNKFKVHDFMHLCNSIEDVIKAISMVEKNRSELDYLTDGAVVKVYEKHIREELGFTSKFPKWAIAFKFKADEVTTILKDVRWQVGRTGKLTPLAILEGVDLSGVHVQKATLNNYGDILRKGVKINSLVSVRRSNDVIPEILSAVEHYENSIEIEKIAVCPYCNSRLLEVGANLFCSNIDCKPRVIAQITNFAQKECMNIEGLKDMTVTALYDNVNVRKFSDLYRLSEESLTSLNNFADKKISNLLQSIENSKKPELQNFLFALGIEGVGKKTAKDLAKNFKSVQSLQNACFDELIAIEDIGDIMASDIVNYFSNKDNLAEIQKLFDLGVNPIYHDDSKSDVLAGETVVLTGGLSSLSRSEAGKLIESHGGKVVGSISKKVSIVVAGENAGSKLDKARALNLRIIDENEFLALITVD